MGSWENADQAHVLWFQFYFPPLGIRRQFTPHMAAATEQQNSTQLVVVFVGQIRFEHQVLVSVTIAVKLFLVELVFEEFRNHF